MAEPTPSPAASPALFLGAPAAPAPGLPLEDGARLAGHHVWLEMRLFEVLGGWVPTVPEADVKAHLATHSRRHAWHAELWHGHLPEVAGIDTEALVAPPGDRAHEVVAALAEPASTVERLAGYYRVVLPRVVTATSRVLARTSAVADAALARSLRFVLGDDLDEWREGEALLQARIAGPDDVDRAAACQARLEKLVVALVPTLSPPPGS